MQSFAQKLGYRFANEKLLVEALTHASHYGGPGPSYQRLEFLGDAILDFLITRHLYETHGRELTPGLLTDLRQEAVCNSTFAFLALSNDFNKYIFHTSEVLFFQISRYHQRIADKEATRKSKELREKRKEREKEEEEEDRGAGRRPEEEEEEEEEEDGGEENETPKVLSDVFESVAAAIFIDSGGDLEKVWEVYGRMMKDFLARRATPSTLVTHPKRRLLELLQARNCKKGEFKYPPPQVQDTASETGGGGGGRRTRALRAGTECHFYLHGEKIGEGRGRNKKSATRKAAERAVAFLQRDPSFLSSHCTCPHGSS